MSRIADVLQKSRKERGLPDKGGDASDSGLRPIADVQIPWQLHDVQAGQTDGRSVPLAEKQMAPAALDKPADMPLEQRIAPIPTPIASRRTVTTIAPAPSEETVALARKVFLSDEGQTGRGRRVLFASVDSPGRSAAIATSLALSVARETPRSVCLIDLNLDAILHDSLQLEASPGLSDVVLQGMLADACTQQVLSAPSLQLLAAGSDARGLRATLQESRTRNRIRALLGIFDYVIAHAAPVTAAEAVGLGGLFDGVVLLVEEGQTSSDVIRTMAAALKEADVKVLGTVVDSRHEA
jgi:Mrp family chromosome partitioning ATPase